MCSRREIPSLVITITVLIWTAASCPDDLPRNCQEVYQNGCTKSGVYTIDAGCGRVKVYCDMNGQWTVFQRRRDGSENFNRGWSDYVAGFGNPKREFWLGLENIHCLTAATARVQLRVDMADFDGVKKYAQYSFFSVGNADTNYRLKVNGYSGTAGDAMGYSNGFAFSTPDVDNDEDSRHCARDHHFGGAWTRNCANANLNGLYKSGWHRQGEGGVHWRHFKSSPLYSLKFAEMKLYFRD